ncbi:acyltransferase, partial [Micromonospora chalcea]
GVPVPMTRPLRPSRRARSGSRAPAVPDPRGPAEGAAADGGARSVSGPAEDIEYAGRRRPD